MVERKLFSKIIDSGKVPKPWLEAKVIAILKPGKPAQDPKSYRPISLLSTVYKLFERVLARRLTPVFEKHYPPEQAGFREGRSTCEQVVALNMHVGNGFQLGNKSGLVLLDLTAAYDTVWKRGLLFKVAKILKCKKTLQLLDNMLSNRKITVHMNGQISKQKILQNGLPQGSVLSPMLFNIYTADVPETMSRKFTYADDIAIVAQTKTFEEMESILNKDLDTLHRYFEKWHLQLNPKKTTALALHLNNQQASREINITLQGEKIPNETSPLGIWVLCWTGH